MYHGVFIYRVIVRLLIKQTFVIVDSIIVVKMYNVVQFIKLGIKCRGTNPRAMRIKAPLRVDVDHHFLRPSDIQHWHGFAEHENKT